MLCVMRTWWRKGMLRSCQCGSRVERTSSIWSRRKCSRNCRERLWCFHDCYLMSFRSTNREMVWAEADIAWRWLDPIFRGVEHVTRLFRRSQDFRQLGSDPYPWAMTTLNFCAEWWVYHDAAWRRLIGCPAKQQSVVSTSRPDDSDSSQCMSKLQLSWRSSKQYGVSQRSYECVEGMLSAYRMEQYGY